MGPSAGRATFALAAAAVALATCGDNEEGFTAAGFVAAVNERGAALELGAALRSEREGAEVFAVELARGRRDRGESHAGGSLTVTEDAAAGLAEHRRCEAAASLLCYRADNVVLLLEPETDRRLLDDLEAALLAIADEQREAPASQTGGY